MTLYLIALAVVVHLEWLTFAVSVVLPALVALVTRCSASPRVKALALAALAALTGVVAQLIQAGGEFRWQAALYLFLTSFITAVVAHFGLLKPLGVTGSDGIVARAVPGGLGSPTPPSVSSRPGTVVGDVGGPGGP